MVRSFLRPPVVLAYHAIGRATDDEDPHRLVLDPKRFDDQVQLLRRRGYRFLTAEQLLAEAGGGPPPRATAVLTFDDGWLDAVTEVAPRLANLGIPASFYVCPGWLDGHHPEVEAEAGRLIGVDGLRALRDAGMEVASHSMRHRDLRSLSDDELAHDVSESRAQLESLLDRPCVTFAYPYGFSDERVEAAVQAAGYRLALGWNPDWASTSWRPLAAPRLPAPPRHGAGRLALKLLGLHR